MNPTESDTDALLIAFDEAGPGADLSDWTRRHPEHAAELSRRGGPALGRRDDAVPPGRRTPAIAARDEAHLLTVARAAITSARAARRLRRQWRPVEKAAEPLASLLAAARARGLEPETVAERLELTAAYFWKLHRRLFAPDSIPRALVRSLAGMLDRTADEVAAYFERPPTLAAGASYRADTAPRPGNREDFAATLRADPELTPAQRTRWLDNGSGDDDASDAAA
jgi:hypothetical protein